MTGGSPRTDPAAWAYVPHARARPDRADAQRVRAGLEAAWRAAHGAGVRVSLHLQGGPEGLVGISVEDAATARWVERALLRAYPTGDWRRGSVPSVPAPVARWSGSRRGLPGEVPRPAPEPGSVFRSLEAALRPSGRHISMTVALRPGPARSDRSLGRWLRRPAAPPTVRRSGAAPGNELHPVFHDPPALTWVAAIDLYAALGTSAGAARTLAAVRSAWTALDGRPLELAERSAVRGQRYRTVLSESEVPALFPSAEGEVLSEPAVGAGVDGIPVGRTPTGSVVRLPLESGQGRHFAVVGETGMGKSSLLVALAARASRIAGVVVLDPLGETAAAIGEELRGRGRKFLWVAPTATRVRTNALAAIASALRSDPMRAERELDDLVHALRRVRAGRYADSSYWGPRLEEMLVRAVRAAAQVPGGTLEDAHALLAHAGGGREVVPPDAVAEVRELATRIRERPEDAEGARRLLYEVVRNPTLSRMLCARAPDLAFPQIVSAGQVVLVSGEAAVVGESTARYLLATYLALLWSSLLAREATPKTFVLLDEAQWFAHESLAEMLRLARRGNVHVGVATQSLASLAAEVQDAVRTNVADLVIFRGSPEDARELGRSMLGPAVDALRGLGRGEAVVVLGKGESVRTIRTARLPRSAGRRAGRAPAAERSAGLPGPPVAPPAGRPADTPEAGVAMATGPTRTDPVRYLAAQLAEHGPDGLLPVDVRELLDRTSADDRLVRALGGELGRRGAIVRTGRGERGPVWWLDPGVLGRLLSERALPSGALAADSPQRL